MAISFDSEGRELLDQRPVAIPIGFSRPETLAEQIRRLIRVEASQAAASQGFETFEEADDFDIEDDPVDPTTPWELDFDQQEAPASAFEQEEAIPVAGAPEKSPGEASRPLPGHSGVEASPDLSQAEGEAPDGGQPNGLSTGGAAGEASPARARRRAITR